MLDFITDERIIRERFSEPNNMKGLPPGLAKKRPPSLWTPKTLGTKWPVASGFAEKTSTSASNPWASS